MKLTKKRIDETQAVLEAMANELNCNDWFRVGIFNRDTEADMDGNGIYGSEAAGRSLHDAYINALHEKAGTEPPPF